MAKEKIIKIGGKEFSPEQVQDMIEIGAINVGQKNDTVQSAFAQAPHGFSQEWPTTGGLLSRPGVEPDIYAAVVGVTGTLANRLFMGVSEIVQPEYEVISGVDAASGSNPTSFAGTAPVPGVVKIGTWRSQLGKFYMSTGKFMMPQIGGRVNRGDVDRRLLNGVFNTALNPLLFDLPLDINSEAGLAFMAFAVHYHRVTSKVLFDGNHTQSNASTETGYIQEFDGFDRLIKTGYQDLETGNAVTAMDSTVVNFASVDVTTMAGADAIVGVLAEVWFKLTTLAEDTGMPVVQWEIAMHRNLFHAITEIYPRSYMTIGNVATSDSDGERIVVSGGELVNFRDEMRRGRFLWINGERVRVNLETGIANTAVSTGFTSAIYFIPMFAGGRKVTYLEGFDQANQGVMQTIQTGGLAPVYTLLNNGLWGRGHNQTGLAFEILMAQQLRLVLRTPQLAARIENVLYNFDQKIYPRDAYPSQTYYADEGRYVSNPYYANATLNP